MERKQMEKIIYIEARKNYGAWVYYPACPQSELFAEIAKAKTLSIDTIKFIEKLGYKVEKKAEQPLGWSK